MIKLFIFVFLNYSPRFKNLSMKGVISISRGRFIYYQRTTGATRTEGIVNYLTFTVIYDKTKIDQNEDLARIWWSLGLYFNYGNNGIVFIS